MGVAVGVDAAPQAAAKRVRDRAKSTGNFPSVNIFLSLSSAAPQIGPMGVGASSAGISQIKLLASKERAILGTDIWTYQNTVNHPIVSTRLPVGVAIDGDGNVYMAGWTDGALPGHTSAGKRGAFVIQVGAIAPRLAHCRPDDQVSHPP